MTDCILINPLGKTMKGHTHFIRDWCGGENVVSLIFPPLELAQTAALLRKHGFSVGIIEANALHFIHEIVVTMVKKYCPHYVVIPSAWASINDDLILARSIKDSLPETKIIFCGVNLTVEPALALDSGLVDYVILGEPEMTCLEIIRGIWDKNVAYMASGKIVKKECSLLDDLDQLPFPARDLLPNKNYCSPFTLSNPFTFMYSGRGCSYKCIFCPSSIWYSHKVRQRSIENIMSEIEEVVEKYKIRDIIFRDPSFTIDREQTVRICEEIIKANYKINWRCFSHVNDIDEELLKLMRRAGCYQISYGFETGSPEVLKHLLKASTIERGYEVSRLTRNAGIEISGSFMLGLPGESKKTINETITFSRKLRLDYAQFQFAIPVPGTKFYEMQQGNKYLTITNDRQKWRWENWEGFIDSGSEFNNNLKLYLRKAYIGFYFNPSYLVSQMRKIKNFRQLALKLKNAAIIFIKWFL
jgi:anaerobic magnesium-protoporphyrin IX monomethyl ester cyclase